MNKNIYVDLTELMTVKGGSFKYYGIARVVAEVAQYGFLNMPNAIFVFHSTDHDSFFRVYPSRIGSQGAVDFNLPDIQTIRYRERTYRKGASSWLTKLLSPVARWINLRRWTAYNLPLEKVDLSNGVLYSSARPKLISNMIMTIRRHMPNAVLVPLVHDLIPLHDFGGVKMTHFGNNFYHDNNFMFDNCPHVIANSVFTQHDIQKFRDAGHFSMPERISAVPLAHELLESADTAEIELPSQPYFLMVGTMLGRKNLDVVLDAYRDFLSQMDAPPKLILAGAIRKSTVKALATERYAAIAEHVEMISSPNETDLKRLYENACALILASHIEGWGLPAGEALWCGTPAICSRIPVLEEVCGDLALYFDPNDPKALSECMLQILESPDQCAALKQKISQAKPSFRTWETVAHDVFAVLQKA